MVTPLVGNDVVDLDDPQACAPHPRFVARVCTSEERTRVAESGDPHATLWGHFAAKEAAYKVVAKLVGAPVIFAHRRFVVSPTLDAVTWGDVRVRVAIRLEGRALHAVAWCGGATPRVALRARAEHEAEGEAARRLLLRHVAWRFGLHVEDLTVSRAPASGRSDTLAPPRVLHRGAPLDVDVSLSHDGRFVACAIDASRHVWSGPRPRRLHSRAVG